MFAPTAFAVRKEPGALSVVSVSRLRTSAEYFVDTIRFDLFAVAALRGDLRIVLAVLSQAATMAKAPEFDLHIS
jgi:hypothetical protein